MKRIVVLYDVDGWAYHRRALAMQRYAPAGYDVTLIAGGQSAQVSRCDVAFLCDLTSSGVAFKRRGARVVKLVGSHTWMHPERLEHDWRTRGVNQHRNEGEFYMHTALTDMVACYNSEQATAFRECPREIAVLPHLVDSRDFYPEDRKDRLGGKLRVGWAYQVNGGFNSFKGAQEVLIPLIARLGDRVEWCVQFPDAQFGMNTDELRRYYNSLDVFLCTSTAEGGPQPPFEAAACGCVVISTNVGQVKDWNAIHECHQVVPEYHDPASAQAAIDSFAEKILYLDRERLVMRYTAQLLRESIWLHYNAETGIPSQLEIICGPH